MPTAREQRQQAIEDIMAQEEGEGHPEPTSPPSDNETDWEEEQQQATQQPEGEQPAEEPQEPAQQPERGDPRIALRQEREENRDLKSEVAELRGQLQALLQQQQQPAAPQQPQQPEEPPDPEPEVPTIEQVRAGDVSMEDYLTGQQKRQAWQDRQREKHEKRVQEFIEQESQRHQQTQQQQQFAQSLQAHEMRFRQTTPDYDDALRHLISERVADLTTEELLPAERAQNIAVAEATRLAQHAMENNRDPAALIYALAQRRGYGAQQQPQPNGGLGGMAQQPAQQQPAQAQQPSQTQQRQPSQAAQAEAALTGASGAPSPGNTLQALLDTPEEDLMSGKVDGRKLLRGG